MDLSPGVHFGWGTMMFLGGLFSILFWVALIAFGVWAVRRFTDRPAATSETSSVSSPGSASSALRILQERLALGEIDPEEYEKIKRALET